MVPFIPEEGAVARDPDKTREYSPRPKARRDVGKMLKSKAEVLAELQTRFCYSESQIRLLGQVANFAAIAWMFQSMRAFHEQAKKALQAVERVELPELRGAAWAVGILDQFGWPDIVWREPASQMELWPELVQPVGRWLGLPNLTVPMTLTKAALVHVLTDAVGASGKALEWGPPATKGRPRKLAADQFAQGLVRWQGKFGRKIGPAEAALLAAYFEIEGEGTPMDLDLRIGQWNQYLHQARERLAKKKATKGSP